MFPFKKKQTPTTEETTDNVAKKGIKTMDTVVTGMILGGIIASLYGVKKLRDKNNATNDEHHDH
ncbi:hypothetical protein K2X92_04670 [Candidatus Gracilibacteria bacterium]|nr:hypothetical protein [Candidatus Gracilibacteria bacterium]